MYETFPKRSAMICSTSIVVLTTALSTLTSAQAVRANCACIGDVAPPFTGIADFTDVGTIVSCITTGVCTCVPTCDVNCDGVVTTADADAAVCEFQLGTVAECCSLGPVDDFCDGTGMLCSNNNDCVLTPSGICGVKNRYLGVSILKNIGTTITSISVTTPTGTFYAGPDFLAPCPPNPPIRVAPLQCVPLTGAFSQVWAPGPLYLFGGALIPGGSYEVRMGPNLLGRTTVETGLWGDIVTAFGVPGQPNFADITALVDKFRSLTSAPSLARADIVGVGVLGGVDIPDQTVNFRDISADVSAFTGGPFPYISATCP